MSYTMIAMAAKKKRAGRGAGGAHHEVALLVRFTQEQYDRLREVCDWNGSQPAVLVREATISRVRVELAEKAKSEAAAPLKGR